MVKELEAFKIIALGEFLAQYPDKPPVPGYTPPTSNSLLDWAVNEEMQYVNITDPNFDPCQ